MNMIPEYYKNLENTVNNRQKSKGNKKTFTYKFDSHARRNMLSSRKNILLDMIKEIEVSTHCVIDFKLTPIHLDGTLGSPTVYASKPLLGDHEKYLNAHNIAISGKKIVSEPTSQSVSEPAAETVPEPAAVSEPISEPIIEIGTIEVLPSSSMSPYRRHLTSLPRKLKRMRGIL